MTHKLQYVERADKILLLNQGEVSTYGSYQSFVRSGSTFSEYLNTTKTNEMAATR